MIWNNEYRRMINSLRRLIFFSVFFFFFFSMNKKKQYRKMTLVCFENVQLASNNRNRDEECVLSRVICKQRTVPTTPAVSWKVSIGAHMPVPISAFMCAPRHYVLLLMIWPFVWNKVCRLISFLCVKVNVVLRRSARVVRDKRWCRMEQNRTRHWKQVGNWNLCFLPRRFYCHKLLWLTPSRPPTLVLSIPSTFTVFRVWRMTDS